MQEKTQAEFRTDDVLKQPPGPADRGRRETLRLFVPQQTDTGFIGQQSPCCAVSSTENAPLINFPRGTPSKRKADTSAEPPPTASPCAKSGASLLAIGSKNHLAPFAKKLFHAAIDTAELPRPLLAGNQQEELWALLLGTPATA